MKAKLFVGVEGLMMDLVISPDNRFVAAYTNNNQTVLLNALISEFVIIENPLGRNETVQVIDKGAECGNLQPNKKSEKF